MGYSRHVICQSEIPFVMNIVINDDSIAFRLLSEINESVNVATDAVQFGVEKLLTTEQLSFNPVAFNVNDKTFLVDGTEYAIYSVHTSPLTATRPSWMMSLASPPVSTAPANFSRSWSLMNSV